MAKVGGGFGKTILWALCLVVLSLVVAVGLARYGCQIPGIGSLIGCTQSPPEVLGIRRLNELATAEMPVQVVVEKEKNVHLFLPKVIPELPEGIFGQHVILVAKGEVKAGINLDDLAQGDVKVHGKKVTIHLPEARILDVTLDEDKTKLYDWDRGLLIKGDYTLVEDARREAVDRIEAAAKDEHIEDRAQENAEDSIREFLTSLGYEKVVFID